MRFDILKKSKSMQALQVVLDKGESIPLHDHPETQVFMYILSGKLKVDFYRYKDDDPKTQTIILDSSQDMTPGAYELVTDDGVNLHHIEALEPSVFLDVMSPGYFENTDIKPTWLEKSMEDGEIKVKEVPQPTVVTEAKEKALEAFDKGLISS